MGWEWGRKKGHWFLLCFISILVAPSPLLFAVPPRALCALSFKPKLITTAQLPPDLSQVRVEGGGFLGGLSASTFSSLGAKISISARRIGKVSRKYRGSACLLSNEPSFIDFLT